MKPIQRSQTIFIQIPSSAQLGTQVYLPDIPELRDAVIDGIETYTDQELTNAPNGQAIIAVASIRELTLNLLQESDRRAQDFPLQSLLAVQYGGIYKEFTQWRLNWQKCYIFCLGTTPADQVVALNVFYHYEKARR
jgi:hypothetical protein